MFQDIKKESIYEKLGYGDLLRNIYKLDTTEIPGEQIICIQQKECIKESLEMASEAFKSDKDILFDKWGSTCGIEAAIMAVAKPKEKIIINRDCHQSAINAVHSWRYRIQNIYKTQIDK